MNTIKAGVKGKFIFSDPITKEKIAEFKNDISDYGMERLSGFKPNNTYAIAENFEFIHLGEDPDPVEKYSIYTLLKPLVPGVDMAVVHASVRDTGLVFPDTRTEYDRNENGDVVIRFINNWDVTFNRKVFIRELGVSHVDYKGNSRSRYGYGGNSQTDNSSRDDGLKDDINFSLFSRAVISPSQLFEAGQSTRVTYICEITLCQESEWSENLTLDTSTLASPAAADIFPPCKINIRQKPFYDLGSSGKPVSVDTSGEQVDTYFYVNGTNTPDTGVKTCPILDSLNQGVWLLDSYLDGDINTFTNTMTANVTEGLNKIPSPVTSIRKVKRNGDSIPLTYKTRHTLGSGITGTIRDHPSQDVWTYKIRFVIRSEEMPGAAATDAKRWTLWRAYDANQQIPRMPVDYVGKNGITFELANAYIPTDNKLFGLDFTISWTRA